MHLYLSSFLLGNDAATLPALTKHRRALVVANGFDHATGDLRASFARSSMDALNRLGFSTAELDLRSHFPAPDRIGTTLADVGLVWVTGGNVFLLRRALRQSGLDRHLLERRRDDTLVYGGFSAGACVAGPTLRGAHLVDTLSVKVPGYLDEPIWDGLGLYPYCIAPHYRSDHPESGRVDAMVDYFIANRLPFVALRDGEAIIATA